LHGVNVQVQRLPGLLEQTFDGPVGLGSNTSVFQKLLADGLDEFLRRPDCKVRGVDDVLLDAALIGVQCFCIHWTFSYPQRDGPVPGAGAGQKAALTPALQQ